MNSYKNHLCIQKNSKDAARNKLTALDVQILFVLCARLTNRSHVY